MVVLELVRLANERPIHPTDAMRCWVWNGNVEGNRRPDPLAEVGVTSARQGRRAPVSTPHTLNATETPETHPKHF